MDWTAFLITQVVIYGVLTAAFVSETIITLFKRDINTARFNAVVLTLLLMIPGFVVGVVVNYLN